MERLTKRNEADTAYYYPDCFKECDGLGYSSKCDKCDLQDKICEKLGEYEDLEEKGLLLRLPCKVGDVAYRISTGFHTRIKKIEKTKISRIAIDESGIVFFCECNPTAKCILGKTVFLTQAEAEETLKGMKTGGVIF